MVLSEDHGHLCEAIACEHENAVAGRFRGAIDCGGGELGVDPREHRFSP
nr:hypothetical protein [Nannocystis sp.]